MRTIEHYQLCNTTHEEDARNARRFPKLRDFVFIGPCTDARISLFGAQFDQQAPIFRRVGSAFIESDSPNTYSADAIPFLFRVYFPRRYCCGPMAVVLESTAAQMNTGFV